VALILAVSGVSAATPAVAATPPPGDRPLWALPDSGDLLAGFRRNEYDEEDGSPRQTASPDRPDQQAVEFNLPGGDQRSEMQPRVPDEVEGTVQYYTYGALLARDFPTDASTWQVILQWHHQGDEGSPPVAVQVRDNRLMLAADGTDLQDLGPIAGGGRVDLTLRIVFSRDPELGTVDVWSNGQHVLQGYHPADGTLFDQSNYMKVGLYRDTSIEGPGHLWLDDLRVGPTLASVQTPDSASSRIPSDSDPANNPSGSGRSPSSGDTLTWVAGGLLVVVVALTVVSLRRRRTHT
jgi:hypothetical protein